MDGDGATSVIGVGARPSDDVPPTSPCDVSAAPRAGQARLGLARQRNAAEREPSRGSRPPREADPGIRLAALVLCLPENLVSLSKPLLNRILRASPTDVLHELEASSNPLIPKMQLQKLLTDTSGECNVDAMKNELGGALEMYVSKLENLLKNKPDLLRGIVQFGMQSSLGAFSVNLERNQTFSLPSRL